MNATGLLAVGIGAALGAWLRWAFALLWNPVFQPLPLGTLAANVVGGFVVTDRMLQMFKRRPEPKREGDE